MQLTPHFIRVQIFQIDLTPNPPFYPHPNISAMLIQIQIQTNQKHDSETVIIIPAIYQLSVYFPGLLRTMAAI